MVEVTTKIVTHDELHRERVERQRKLRQRPSLRVVPTNDDMRRLLKHPKAGRFRAEGAMEWPDDNFTRKRLRDGDIALEEKSEAEAKPEAEAAKHEAGGQRHKSH